MMDKRCERKTRNMKKVLDKINKNFYVQLLLFLTAVILLISSYRRSQESHMAYLFPVQMQGEYSQDGGEWKTYQAGEKISALNGDLVFRGNFALDLSDVTEYQFYLDHVELTIYRNWEKVFSSAPDFPLSAETTCVETWHTWYCDPVQTDEILEFRLHNPHKVGNVQAYQSFLDSIYPCSETILQGRLHMSKQKEEIMTLVIMISAIILLGMAAGCLVIDYELGRKLWPLGLLTLFMSGYILFDLPIDIVNYYKDILATNGQRICMMFAAYEISVIVQNKINESRSKKLPPLVLGLSIFNMGLLLVAFLGNTLLYDTLQAWQIVQGIVFGVLIVAGIKSFMAIPTKKWNLLCSGILLMCSVVLEFFNSYCNLWNQGFLWKVVFVICLIHHLLVGIRTVPKNYRASKETERLKRELTNSRVVLAMSQIRTHFIFNVLNAISGMCIYDPAEANRTVVHFAKYLRGNINILQDDELILFAKEMDHLENYIVLEKIRFDEKIRFEKELEVEEFLIPPLILQPIVENAIKHGLLRTKEGGYVQLCTRREDDQVIIEIKDNGAGFNVHEPIREGAVGINNVKFRLEYMIGGKMEIKSEPEKGTTVMIRMPYVTL